MEFRHISVLYEEVMSFLQPQTGEVFIDGTVGGGGHSYGIVEHIGSNGRLLAIDQDQDALLAAKEKLKNFSSQIDFRHTNFEYLPDLIHNYYPDGVDGILLDIGVSSPQIDKASRGFSYMKNATLDMRMDTTKELNAKYIVNNYGKSQLEKIFREYGEEKWSSRITDIILEKRIKKPIETTFDLVDCIERAIPKGVREKGSHVAKRTFQALRIAVNDELGVLERVIDGAISCLKKNGRMGIITFHSLEDRIVKNKFRYHALSCVCPHELPLCTCDKVQTVEILTKKPIMASEEEIEKNPRSKSAKLRVVKKII